MDTMTRQILVLVPSTYLCIYVQFGHVHVQVVGMGGDCVGGWNIYRAYIFPQNAKLFFSVG